MTPPSHAPRVTVEHEAKFLVVPDAWPRSPTSQRICQAYLCTDPERTVRVRRSGTSAWLTIKGKDRAGSRPEFEYSIPTGEAELLLQMCSTTPIEKFRHTVPAAFTGLPPLRWEIDEFTGANRGLVVAEIEVEHAPQLALIRTELPAWIGREITTDYRYSNAMLAEQPFDRWAHES